jgi:hypothetical protein
MPDRVFTTSNSLAVTGSLTPLSAASNNGDWYYDNVTSIFSYIGTYIFDDMSNSLK